MAFSDSRSWGISLGLRIPALFFNIFSIVCFSYAFPEGMLIWIILFSIVALWSLIDLIFLLDYRDFHPGIDLGLDLLSLLILGIMGIIAIGLYFTNTSIVGLDVADYCLTILRVGAVLAPIAADFHLVLFVRACIHVHQRRREGKKLNYEISEDNRI
ncbi:uncharacterized protein EURHEDRAFT_380654 [Aspergillus ruber CBS 135680]|uniref:MARVEL domain-containing protein n=1 Tax=Aspergillus ruber (strain CBS 135680) TaxID=1388766 RepID=A0A017S593_ASPRC|nr:uncharacterized protein EURHEDRAFT_380654 [Aspergillus ruber CBS 135680]EYE92001.1 hypothetical protein EURHEDRAFT_380654 [Aspergillus ruber CBS 135680]